MSNNAGFSANLTSRLAAAVRSSGFLRLIESFFAFLGRLCAKSYAVKAFFLPVNKDVLNRSVLYSAYRSLLLLPARLQRAMAPVYQKSLVLRAFKNIKSCFSKAAFCDVGLSVFTAGAAVLLFKGFSPVTAFVCVMGFALLFINIPVYDALLNSFAARFLIYCFNVRAPLPRAFGRQRRTFKNKMFFFVYGVYAGAAFLFLPSALYSVCVCALPMCVCVLFSYPFSGVLAAAFLTPFLPTLVLAGLVCAIFAAFFYKLASSGKYSINCDITGFFTLIFMGLSVLSAVFSLTPARSVSITALLTVFYASFFLVSSLTKTRGQFEALVFAVVLSALFAGLYGFLQAMSGFTESSWVDKKLFEGLGMRVFSTFSNPNVYGEYLLIAIGISVIGVFVYKRLVLKVFCLLTAAVLCVNLALTYSRGCYLALVFAALVFVIMTEKRLLAVFAAGLFTMPLILPQSVINRLLSVGNLNDSSSKYRLSIYQASVRLLKNFWPAGVGQGEAAFNRVFPFYAFNGVTAQHAHNLFLQTFVETGLFGFTAFLCVIAAFFKTLSRAYINNKSLADKRVLACFAAIMCGFCFQGFFDYTFYNYRVCMLFFFCLGLPAIYLRFARE